MHKNCNGCVSMTNFEDQVIRQLREEVLKVCLNIPKRVFKLDVGVFNGVG